MNNGLKETTAKKQKKILIIVMASLLAFVAIYYAIAAIDFDKLFGIDKGSQNGDGTETIYFYDESLSKNIFQDEEYMAKNRSITFANVAWGTSETLLDEDDAVTAGPAANLIYNMLGYILTGNHDGYNSCFSDFYYQNGGELQGRFTQQKIYNITISEVSVTDKTDENGSVYKEYYYTLEYMIRHNNGSLRDDMGSDCIKTQHLYLSERYSNEVLIDKIYTMTYIQK